MVRLFLRFSGDRWRKHFDYVNYNSILASRRRKRPLGAVRSPRSNEHFGIIEGREEKKKGKKKKKNRKKLDEYTSGPSTDFKVRETIAD